MMQPLTPCGCLDTTDRCEDSTSGQLTGRGLLVLLFTCATFFVTIHIVVQHSTSSAGITHALPESNRQRLAETKDQNSDNGRIVGGEPTGANKYPFMVALYRFEETSGSRPACGGSLITPSVVLTAAHCVASIKAAEINRYDFNSNAGVELYIGLERRSHPDYNSATYDHDVALIKLSRPQPNPSLVAIQYTPEIPKDLTVMGWGVTEYLGTQPNELRETQLTRVPDDTCGYLYNPQAITTTMLCAAAEKKDSCQGDSGGPLIITGLNIQVGIVSWGKGCSDPDFPGVYTRIQAVYDWIQDTICNDLSKDDCVNGTIPFVNDKGETLSASCSDKSSFQGLGKKGELRDCEWVAAQPERRCKWYGDRFCPKTCKASRCL